MEIFLQFSKQSVVISGSNVSDEFEEIARNISDDVVDCVCVVEDLIDRIVSLEAIQPDPSIVSYADFCFFRFVFVAYKHFYKIQIQRSHKNR